MPKRKNAAGPTADDLLTARRALPVWSARQALLDEVAASPTVILTGDTGCGKTTQIPQFLHAAGYSTHGLIGVTQPRRVAAMSVAQRVALEMGVQLGELVGYCVRFDDRSGPATRIRYLTDGMLLREAMGDPLLRRYAVIIVDEAHERSLQTDVVTAILKAAQAARALAPEANGKPLATGDAAPTGKASASKAAAARVRPRPLKLLLMSATLELDVFCDYFSGAPAVQVLGRAFPVQVMYAPEPQPDYVEAAVTTVMQLHLDAAPGDILVFLTGQEDIEARRAGQRRHEPTRSRLASPDPQAGISALQQRARLLPAGTEALLALPLYASLPAAKQMAALEPAPRGTRKVILATNIAETSITIDGVLYVVDAGLAKTRAFHAGKGIDSLLALPVSQAAAKQRAGRAGRQAAGVCYRLYTEQTFGDLEPASVAEVHRVSLAGVVLSLKALGVDDVLRFDFVQPPARAALAAALEQLLALGALGRRGELTPLGRSMAALPLAPVHARALVGAAEHECLPQMLTLLAILSVDGAIFHAPAAQRDAANDAKRQFLNAQGDTLTLLNVFASFVAATRGGGTGGGGGAAAARAWCESHFVSRRSLESAFQIRQQLAEAAARLKLGAAQELELPAPAAGGAGGDGAGGDGAGGAGVLRVDAEVGQRVRRCLTGAFFMQAAERQPSGEYLALTSRQSVAIHPSSVLFSRRANCVLFNELLFTTRLYMREVTQIERDWLPELAPQYFGNG